MKCWELEAGSDSFAGLKRVEREMPRPAAGQVLVKMAAAALNYRDLMIAQARYFRNPVRRSVIPLSDGAGTVVEVGPEVTEFQVGDRVIATFFQVAPTEPPNAAPKALGAPLDGTLSEYQVFYERGLVRAPAGLEHRHGATLPCAGVTAWNALLGGGRPVRPGETVLTLGTGGVSSFAILLGRTLGARVLVTSSSDEKLERARGLGATHTVNYRTTPAWDEPVLVMTDGRGVDCIVENGGPGTLERSLKCLAQNGKIAIVGVLAGERDCPSVMPLLMKRGHMHGVYVGERQELQDLARAMDINTIRPVIDRVFGFDEVPAAYEYQSRGQHFGKVVIEIS